MGPPKKLSWITNQYLQMTDYLSHMIFWISREINCRGEIFFYTYDMALYILML